MNQNYCASTLNLIPKYLVLRSDRAGLVAAKQLLFFITLMITHITNGFNKTKEKMTPITA